MKMKTNKLIKAVIILLLGVSAVSCAYYPVGGEYVGVRYTPAPYYYGGAYRGPVGYTGGYHGNYEGGYRGRW